MNRFTFRQLRLWMVLGLAVVSLYFGFAAALDKLLPRWEGVWDYSHGYLVCGMIAWLLVERVRQLSISSFAPSISGLVALTAVASIYSVLQWIDFSNGMFAIFPVALLAILWAFGGNQLLRIGTLPVLLILFAIPFWDRMVPWLQDLATIVVRDMLHAVGIPALAEGRVIRTARAAVEVAPACSGMTFLLASLTLCSFYAIAWLRSWWSGLLLASVGVVVAIVSNWLRIFIITVAGHFSDMQHYLIVEDHEFFGWALFSVFMVGLILFARRLELRGLGFAGRSVVVGEDVPQTDSNDRGAVTSATLNEGGTATGWSPRAFIMVAFGLLVLVLPIVVRPEPVQPRTAIEMTLQPHGTSEWQRSVDHEAWTPDSPNPASVLRQAFARAGARVDAYVAYYPIQSPGGKVTSTAHRLTPDWQVVADHQSPRAAWVVREQEAVRGDQRRLIWSWFSVAGSRVPTLSQAKLHEMLGILNGDRSGAVFAVSAVCRDTCDDAAHRLEDFLTYSGEALHQLSDTNPVREL